MEVRYFRDPETELPHIFDHGVTEAEAERILAHPSEDGPSPLVARIATGGRAD